MIFIINICYKIEHIIMRNKKDTQWALISIINLF